MDLFKTDLIACTPNPNQVMYLALHQDYSEDYVYDKRGEIPDERGCGDIIVKRLLKGDRGHFGVLEHPQITFNLGYFPHSALVQARTHRIGTSFDVQSLRYTGSRFLDVATGKRRVEDVFYIRPVGTYRDRSGEAYEYSTEMREDDIRSRFDSASRYFLDINRGIAEEHARGGLASDYRQHAVVSFNLRSALHFQDLRAKQDAQLEIREMAKQMWSHIRIWVPEISAWYEKHRMGKAKLAP